ncbi:hypothetical protein UFOVP349_22 [uncultured Caudovirales phage]|uniref:Uncharacterized protein n=1 Tax=uncultured Caudovirales phage TaxID=2100421 RepID=A0A6J5M1Q8_9CAUD|nr:hypothetical protein UFOVP349_22 [uncultured Caudovirales phage]
MKTYTVRIKNISAQVDKMTLAKGEWAQEKVIARDNHHAIQIATQRLFDGCKMHVEGAYGTDGTLIGSITTGKNMYGKILAEEPVAARHA